MTEPDHLQGQVRQYLTRAGWAELPPGPVGSLWERVHSDFGEQTVAVPRRLRTGQPEWQSVLESLAGYERKTVDEIRRAIEHPLVDMTFLRAANDIVIAGSIPLRAAVTLVASAQAMLRATATTAQYPRAHIGGNFSRVADRIAVAARLGHTLEGSYILPLLMPLPDVPADAPDVLRMDDGAVERVAYEPAERRVMRTLAQALTAVRQGIVDPAKQPRARDMAALVAAGVSREFIVAIHRIVTDPAVATFEASFEWASSTVAPGGIPARVEIPSESADLLAASAVLLKSRRQAAAQSITGPIVEVRHVPGDLFGEIAVQTTRSGRPSEVRVRLRGTQLVQLDGPHEWMTNARTVVVDGPVVREPGQPLRIVAPTRVQPLDQSFLGGDAG